MPYTLLPDDASVPVSPNSGDSGKPSRKGYTLLPDEPAEKTTIAQDVSKGALNLLAGGVRGAGSIGATLMWPIDAAQDAIHGDRGKNLSSLITGKEKLSRNQERRQQMDEVLSQEFGADTDSMMYKGGKLAGEVAGTAGAGGILANGARAIPLLSRAAPVIDAIRTSGMSAGGATGLGGAAARATGGAITGGASAGLVNPEDAGTGALIGAAAPGVIQLVGKAGGGVRNVLRGPQISPDAASAINKAREAGYVLPPTVRPTLANRLLEGFSGKLTTAQNASAKNSSVTDDLAAKAIGLPSGAKITPEVLDQVRAEAGTVYHDIKTLGNMRGDSTFNNQVAGLKGAYEGAAKDFPGLAKPELSNILDSLKTPNFKASSAVDAIRLLREQADKAYANGDKGVGKALRKASTAMEDLVERNLMRMNSEKTLDSILKGGGSTEDIVRAGLSNNAPQVLRDFRDARKVIAKTYTIQGALNPSTGSVDAVKLGAQLKRGRPLSDELKTAADFANRFPKAAQTVEKMGSLPQTSPLDWSAAGLASLMAGNPLPMAAVMARPGARALSLSNMVQNRLTQQPGNSRLAALLRSPDAQQALLRSVPIAGSQR